MNEKKRKFFIRALCVFLAVLMAFSLLLSVIPARAVNRSDIKALEEKKEELEKKSQELQDSIDAMETQHARYIDRKAVLDQRIQCNRDEIAVIEQQIALYDQQIQETRERLAEATAAEETQYDLLRKRMRSMEESGTLSYVNILVNANSLTDLLGKITDISDIMEYDKALQASYTAVRSDVTELSEQLEEQQRTQSAIIQEMEFKQQQMEAQTTAAYEMIANLENDMEAYNTAMAENDEAEAALQKEIDALMAKLREEEAAAAAAAEAEKNKNNGSSGGGTGGSVMGTGDFRWPVDCYLITSEYGYRIHPIQNVTKFHAGVDIGAQSGQSIYASAAGTVAVSTYNDSYGNYVLINHGGGNATLYAHMSSTAVTAGQYVSQGQVIGYVGSTGWSRGPHLHFEIRLNGSTVNPLQFFSGYTIYNG